MIESVRMFARDSAEMARLEVKYREIVEEIKGEYATEGGKKYRLVKSGVGDYIIYSVFDSDWADSRIAVFLNKWIGFLQITIVSKTSSIPGFLDHLKRREKTLLDFLG